MTCLMVIVALLIPRIFLIFTALLTNWFNVFETKIWPFLGFWVMPYTTLAYMAGMLNNGQMTGEWLFYFILAIVVDVCSWKRSINDGKGINCSIRKRESRSNSRYC